MLLNVNNFYNELLKTININNSFLLCISGGLDSMVLLDLFLKCNLHIVVAHVNFNIRKHSSIRDAFFVKQFCEKQKIIFHYKELDIYNFMQINKFSVQMAARFMRYKWFNELCKKYNYNFMVLGHHLDDSIETFFINLFRGTGLQGLTGIKYIDNNILRPLTLFTRYQIFKYARINNILWREDVSNYENLYLRNKIRHNIIPIIKKYAHNFYRTFTNTFNIIKQENVVIKKYLYYYIKYITISHVKKRDNFLWKIDLSKLLMFYPLSVILKAIFLNYGFSKLYNLKCFILSSSSGKSLYTSKYRLIKHAKYLILTYNIKIINKCFFIHNINICRIIYPINLLFINSVFIDDKANICIDYKKIILPIYLRRWRVGDYFYPLGLNGKKKVSKYFKDQKLSILERENIWLLINGDDKIIWIVNYILDDRFKITTSTINVLNIYL